MSHGFSEIIEIVTLLQNFNDLAAKVSGTPPEVVQPRDILQMLNENPGSLQQIMNMARDNPSYYGMTESETSGFSSDYVDDLFNQWRFLPSDYNLALEDYNALDAYFRQNKQLSSLSDRQLDLLESLTYQADDFSVDSGLFDFESDAVNAYNLREQLLGRLQRNNVLSKEILEHLDEADEWPEYFKEQTQQAKETGHTAKQFEKIIAQAITNKRIEVTKETVSRNRDCPCRKI